MSTTSEFSPFLGKRKAILVSFGFIEICCGVALVTIGCWALSEFSDEFEKVMASPMWVGFMFVISGYSSMSIKSNSGRQHLLVTATLSAISLVVAMAITNWYFIILIKTEATNARLFYVISLCLTIIQCILGGAATCLACILRVRYEIDAVPGCRERGFTNRGIVFLDEEFGTKPPSVTGAPPPYCP